MNTKALLQMKKFKLDDICIFNEKTISRQKNRRIHYLDTSSLVEGEVLSVQLIELFEAPSRAQRIVKNNTILYSLVRPNLKHYGILSNPEPSMIASTGFVTIDIKEEYKEDIDAYFLYLLIIQNCITNYLQGIAENATSAYPSLVPSDLSKLTFDFPTIDEQRRISNLFQNINSKINLNRAVNHNLEAMAKQLYDYWFVQLDFPNEEGKPYKSSGGKMVWNEKLKREIPISWRYLCLNEIEPNIVTGKTPSTTDESNFGGDVPFITIDDIRQSLFVIQTARTLSERGANAQSKKYLSKGALCCSCIGTAGVLGFVGRKGQTNQQINSIEFEHKYNREFLYFSLGLYFRHTSAKVGNILPNMSKDEFSQIPVLYPMESYVIKYHQMVQNLFNQIELNISEINTLTKQRNELLPLLMNGQVSLNSD